MNKHTPSSRMMLAFATATGLAIAAGLKPPVAANYARPFEPPTRPAFIALPPGAVEPAGWLRDWCVAAKDGYTGHMDDVDVEFRRAWAGERKAAWRRTGGS